MANAKVFFDEHEFRFEELASRIAMVSACSDALRGGRRNAICAMTSSETITVEDRPTDPLAGIDL